MKKKETLHSYIRVSSDIQLEGASLDTQEELGAKKAEELGFNHQVWNEGSASSHHEDFANRPVLHGLLNQIRDGLVKHLYVYNNDRLSRNRDTQHIIRKDLTDNQVRLYTKDGAFDLNNPQDEFVKGLLDGVAQYNNAITAERSRLGKIAKVKQGYWYGGPTPYGYKSVDKKLTVDKKQSKWVKNIYDWYYNGKSIIWIKSQLDMNGVLAKRGGLFSPESINQLLKNTHYIGYYSWKDKKSKNPIQCSCPSIVDETVWSAVQERRKNEFARTKQNNRTEKFYLLRDLMVCGECGSNMSARDHTNPNGNQQIYFCSKKTKDWKKGVIPDDLKWKRGKVGDRGCTMNRSLNIPITDKQVSGLIMDTVSNSSLLKERFKKKVLQPKFKNDEETERLLNIQKNRTTRLKRQIKEVQTTLGDVETDNLLKKYDDVVYQRVKENLVGDIKSKKDALEQTRIRTKELGNQKKWLDWLGKYGEDLTLIGDLPKEGQKEYFHRFVDRIEVRLEKETNDHLLTVYFQLGLVGDGIEYTDTDKGYTVVEGGRDASVVVSRKKTQEMQRDARITGRKRQVKKKTRGFTDDDPTYHLSKSVHHRGVATVWWQVNYGK
jgi:DNA invertase Pin-like site-specific DNA recombinase